MAAFTRRQYSGAARNTTTTTLLTAIGLTVDIADNTGWPSIAGVPFFVVLSPGSIYEEKCLATISGTTLTLTRAQDDTTASEHPIGSVVYPVFTATDADEANELASKLTTAGDLLTTDGTNINRIGVGADGTVLIADSSAENGLTWGSANEIDAAYVVVNANNAATGNFTAGLEVERGASPNVRLRWNEQTDKWQFTNDGTTYTDIGSITVSDTAPAGANLGDLWYSSIELEVFIYYSSNWLQVTDSSAGVQELYELIDVLIDDPVSDETIVYNGTEWENAIPPRALRLNTPRTISLIGFVSGSVSFDGSQNAEITTSIPPSSIGHGVDTYGNYVSDVIGGTGVTVTHTAGESSSASIAIGQDVSTSASVTFQNLQVTEQIFVSEGIDDAGIAFGEVGLLRYYEGMGGERRIHLQGLTAGVNDEIVLDAPNVNVSNDFSVVGDSNFTGDVTVKGDLTVDGLTTTINTQTLEVADNIVVLNSNVSASPTIDAGIEINRGTENNVSLRWNETTDSWEITEDGSTYKNIAVGQDVETSSSVTFVHVSSELSGNVTGNVTGDLFGNADTATSLETARIIELSGDVSGSASFDGTSNIDIFTTVNTSSVAITELFGVDIISPEEFQTLEYDGQNWVNKYASVVTYVRNVEATPITTGTCVYLFGATGDHATVKRADNGSDATSSKTVGVAGADILANENGPVITRGYVDGINLSVGYTAGDVLWLGEDGAFTNIKPTTPDHLVFIGVVVRATNNGIIYVAAQNGYEIDELHDVAIVDKTSGDFLKYNGTLWVNDQINLGTDTVGNYMLDITSGVGVTIIHTQGEGSSASIEIGQDVSPTASVTFTEVHVLSDMEVDGTLTAGGNTWQSDQVILAQQIFG